MIAQFHLGMLHECGNGLELDMHEALKWYTKAAEQGDANAAFKLGTLCKLKPDLPKALEWFMKAAEKGHVEAPVQLGIMYHEGCGAEQNFSEALHWYLEAAK